MSKRRPIDEFDVKLERRRKGISKFLFFPNFVDEFTKSPLVTVLFFVLFYKIYLEVDSIIRIETKVQQPSITLKLLQIFSGLNQKDEGVEIVAETEEMSKSTKAYEISHGRKLQYSFLFDQSFILNTDSNRFKSKWIVFRVT